MSDQPFWGRRVHALGAGPRPIPRSKLTTDNLAAAITEATTSPSIRQKSAELGVKITAEDGVGEAVNTIREVLS
jgi:sterol 3beta-glucosyltransferase